MTGLKETLEVLDALQSVMVAYKGAMDDGKITIFDAKYLAEPLMKFKEALKGVKEVPAELADLDGAEWGQLIDKVIEVGKAAVEASEKL